MHLGVALLPTHLTRAMPAFARTAEGAGFESLFVAEHTHIPTSRRTAYPMGGELPPEYARTQDPFVALMAAAAVTERLRIGTGVCLVVERDPIVLAKEVSTLDVLSGGRVLLGVGAGWNAEELAHHGVELDDRFDVLQQRVGLTQALGTHDVASYDGKPARLEPSWQWPKPSQSTLPVLVGGGGRRAMALPGGPGGGRAASDAARGRPRCGLDADAVHGEACRTAGDVARGGGRCRAADATLDD